MIKKIFYGMFVMCMMLTYSCKDEDLAPIITFDQAGKGAYARLVELRTGEFDLNNLSTSAYDASVDFVDIDGGNTVTNYDIYVSYTDNSPGGALSKGEQLYKAYTAGDFGTSTKGNVGKDLNIPLSDLTTLLGLELSDAELIAGNFFNVRTTITSDGVERGFSNSSSAVNGPAFQGHFNFAIKVTCPVADDRFVGEYSMEYVTTEEGCFGAAFDAAPLPNVTISTVAGSSTKRTMGVTYLPVFGGFAVTLEIDLVCTEIVTSDNDSGVGCAASIILGSGENQPFDFDDDSEISFQFVEFAEGDCGCAAVPYTMKLTKL